MYFDKESHQPLNGLFVWRSSRIKHKAVYYTFTKQHGYKVVKSIVNKKVKRFCESVTKVDILMQHY